MRFIILGGGCYGTFYAQQLQRAEVAGALSFEEVLVVDHGAQPPVTSQLRGVPRFRVVQCEWDDFFDEFLEYATPDSPDLFVPSPFNPHLGLAWLRRQLGHAWPNHEFSLESFSRMPGTPFQAQREHGTLVASHADWICPVHCIEPAICPKTRDTRYWDMDRTGRQLAEDLSQSGQPVQQVHLFHCHHLAFGVGGYPVAELAQAREDLHQALARDEGAIRALVGTISHCHGAFHLLVARSGMDTVSKHWFPGADSSGVSCQ